MSPPLGWSWRSMCILRITEVGVKAAMVGLKPFDGDAPRLTVGPPCVVVGERALWVAAASCCLRRFSFCFCSSRIFLSRAVCRMD